MTGDQERIDGPAAPDARAEAPLTGALDTSFLITALVEGTDQDRRLRQWIQQGTDITMSSIGWAEFLCGPVSEEDRKRARTVIGMPLP